MIDRISGQLNDDDFDNQVKLVKSLLNNPSFVEEINSTIISNYFIDGRRQYTTEIVDLAEDSKSRAKEDNYKFEPDNICFLLGQGLATNTDNFTKNGSFILNGKPVFTFVDSFIYHCQKLGADVDDISLPVEAIISGALGIGFDIPFTNYQTDVSIVGQGLLHNTYSMKVEFRPVSKNIAR